MKIPLDDRHFIFFYQVCFQNFSETQLAYLMNSSFRRAVMLVWISGRILCGTVALCVRDFWNVFVGFWTIILPLIKRKYL